jgi:GcrA cell cycle regulator
MFKKTWPQPHDDALRTMAAQGKTNGEIARLLNEKFGTTYSRNAAIGRASRMGLRSQSGDKGGDASPKPKRTRKRSPSTDDKIRIAARSNLPASYVRAAQPRMVCDAPPLADDRGGSGARNVALVELTGCRWPSGDGIAVPFTFCNASKAFKGCAYCADHRRMALRNAA